MAASITFRLLAFVRADFGAAAGAPLCALRLEGASWANGRWAGMLSETVVVSWQGDAAEVGRRLQ
jgi:hypothetical protein